MHVDVCFFDKDSQHEGQFLLVCRNSVWAVFRLLNSLARAVEDVWRLNRARRRVAAWPCLFVCLFVYLFIYFINTYLFVWSF